MKKIFFLLCLAMLSIASFSQQIPKGMKYQGVSRNLNDVALAEQKRVLDQTEKRIKSTTAYFLIAGEISKSSAGSL